MPLFPCVEEEARREGSLPEPQILMGHSYKSGDLISYLPPPAPRDHEKSKKENKKKKKDGKKKKKRKENPKKRPRERDDDNSHSDSFDSSDSDHDQKVLLSPNYLYLPNGTTMTQTPLANNSIWKIDKRRDEDFLQMGSFYRLDLPSYDISILPRAAAVAVHDQQIRKINPIQQISKMKDLLDSHRYSRRSRYYSDLFPHQNWDRQIYRPRLICDPKASMPVSKKMKFTSFMIPLPLPLPREDQIQPKDKHTDPVSEVMKSDVEVTLLLSLCL
jgi:hypothetical protein